MRARRYRPGRSSLSNTFFLALLAAGGFFGYLFVPKWWDYMEMKEIARLAANRWSASGSEQRARQEYRETMEAKEMPYYIPDDACVFDEKGDMRLITCSWAGDVTVPVLDHVFKQNFKVVTEVSPTGKVRQWSEKVN